MLAQLRDHHHEAQRLCAELHDRMPVIVALKQSRNGSGGATRRGADQSAARASFRVRLADPSLDHNRQIARTDISSPPLKGRVIVRKRCAGSWMKAK